MRQIQAGTNTRNSMRGEFLDSGQFTELYDKFERRARIICKVIK